MAKLMPCTGCARHVRAEAETCPFCGAEVEEVSTPGTPTVRLGRAALFAFGTTVLAAGCGDSHGPDDDAGPGGGTDAGPGGGTDAGPGFTDAGPGGMDAGYDAGNVAPPYGIPPDDAGPERDAGERDSGPSVALYGGAPEP